MDQHILSHELLCDQTNQEPLFYTLIVVDSPSCLERGSLYCLHSEKGIVVNSLFASETLCICQSCRDVLGKRMNTSTKKRDLLGPLLVNLLVQIHLDPHHRIRFWKGTVTAIRPNLPRPNLLFPNCITILFCSSLPRLALLHPTSQPSSASASSRQSSGRCRKVSAFPMKFPKYWWSDS